MTEAKVMDIARQLLEVLEYLSNLRPPVVHRDVKVPHPSRSSNSLTLLTLFRLSAAFVTSVSKCL